MASRCEVGIACNGTCDPQQDVPLLVHSSRGGVSVRVTVVRSPHVYVGEAPEITPWATAPWLDGLVRTGEDGNATVEIPHPNDELGSTYGVHVESRGATADTRVTVPTAQAAIRLTVDRAEQSLGAPLGFDVYAETLDGKPLANAAVTVAIAHGASVAQQQLTLDGDGHARGTFSAPDLGTNFLFASVDHGGRAIDAAQVRIDPQAAQATTDGGSPNVHVTLDRNSYRADEDVTVDAAAPGSQGNALITFESALGTELHVVKTDGGRAVARLRAINAPGELRVGAAFVRDGAIEWNTVPLVLSAPGRPRDASIALGSGAFAPGESAKVGFDGATSARGHVHRSHQSRRAVGKRALCVGARVARNRRLHHAEQRGRNGDMASLGELDRRTRAGARIRTPHRTSARACAGASRNGSRFVECCTYR